MMPSVPVGPVWRLAAHAKLNLSLRIVGRRADGYHLLETLFHELALHDDLDLAAVAEPGIALVVTADDPGLQVTAGPDNLVCRALSELARVGGYDGGFAVRLHKRIPNGGGLGGGSSDAAAALRLAVAAVPQLAGVDLHPIAAKLGADVAFFLRGGSQWGRGVGDELSPAAVRPGAFVLILPPFGCPTVEVYKMYAALWTAHGKGASVHGRTPSGNSDALDRMDFVNDLLPAAERVRPQLVELRRYLADAGFASVAMTGSGSTLFVPCRDDREAQDAAARLGAVLAASPQHQACRLVVTASADGTRRAPVMLTPPNGGVR